MRAFANVPSAYSIQTAANEVGGRFLSELYSYIGLTNIDPVEDGYFPVPGR